MREKQNIVRAGAVIAVALLLSTVLSPVANAATENPTGAFNFTVSPPAVAIQTQPGVPISVNVRIQNQGLATEKVKATLMKFDAQGDTGLPNLLDLKTTDQTAKWAQLSPTTFTAEPNTWSTVKLTITPPKDAAFGYYYAVLFSREGQTPELQNGKNNLLAGVASLVLLDVKAPGAVRKLEVDKFSTSSNSSEFLPVNFNVRLHNVGNTHAGVRGSISISKNKKVLDEITVNASNGYILPKSYRTFTTKWDNGSPVYVAQKDSSGKPILDGTGLPKQSLTWDKFNPSKLRFGKYDARLVMIYNDGEGEISTVAKLSFWVIPWRLIIPIVLVVLLLLAGLWAVLLRPLYRRFTKRRGYAEHRH